MPTSTPNPKVDTFLRQAKTWQAEMEALRKILLGFPLTEDLKWGKPCYTLDDTNLVVLAAFKDCAVLIFCKGALLKDPHSLLYRPSENTQGMRQLRLASLAQITRLKPTLKAYIQEAIDAEKAGLKVTFKKITEFPVPAELQARLDKDTALKTAFHALTPGRQRAYLLHFAAPKQAQTRESRIDKCIPQILQGKGLNDDYRSKK